MVRVQIIPDRRGGNNPADWAVKLLQCFPEAVLCMRTQYACKYLVKKFNLPPSVASRVITTQTDLRGTDFQLFIEFLG